MDETGGARTTWEMKVCTNLTRVSQESTQDGQSCKDNIRVAYKEIGV
jgi:hypothetical protein